MDNANHPTSIWLSSLFFPLVNTRIAFFSLRNLRPIAFDSVDPLAGAVALSAVFPDLPRASPSAS